MPSCSSFAPLFLLLLTTGAAAHAILGIPFIVALLLGATIASTDPAPLVPVFKQVHIKDRVAQTVMSESAFNDAMGAIITFPGGKLRQRRDSGSNGRPAVTVGAPA